MTDRVAPPGPGDICAVKNSPHADETTLFATGIEIQSCDCPKIYLWLVDADDRRFSCLSMPVEMALSVAEGIKKTVEDCRAARVTH